MSTPQSADCPPNQTLEGRGAAPPSGLRYVLVVSLAAYVVLTTALSISQNGYFNADFIAYSTLAHRLLQDPGTSLSGYWSPLMSWCLAPLLAAGVDDLIAGRIILVAAGFLYLCAVYGVVCRFHTTDARRRNRRITVAVMTVAVLQAATWATCLLDPDLLADALLFCCFYLALDPKLPERPLYSLLGGAIAGMTYLAKAYMLPFVLLHLAATCLLRWWTARRGGQAAGTGVRRWAKMWGLFLLGQAAIAGPWIAVLTAHYGKLTISTAAAANHANVGPDTWSHNPLWHPGIAREFAVDPHFGPDWSPWQDTAHFLHQLELIAYNLNNCLGHVAPWVLLGGIVAVVHRRRRGVTEGPPCPRAFPGLGWCIMTVCLYCGGYCLIRLESRYLVAVVNPLCCLGAMLVFCGPAARDRTDGTGPRQRLRDWWLIPLVLLVSFQDLNRMNNILLYHTQSSQLAAYRSIGKELRKAGFLPHPFTVSRWHEGLSIAYAADDMRDYLGTPEPDSATSMMEQLKRSGSVVHLRWRNLDDKVPPRAGDALVPEAPWTLAATLRGLTEEGTVLEVYVLPDAAQGTSRSP